MASLYYNGRNCSRAATKLKIYRGDAEGTENNFENKTISAYSASVVKSLFGFFFGCGFVALGLLVIGMPGVARAQDLTKLTVAYSSRSIAPIDYFIAEQYGLFKAEGLDVRLVQIRANVAVVAMLAGEVDALASISTAISAAQRGAPIKILAVTLYRPLFWLVTRPEFKNISELRGKIVGAVSLGGAQHTALRYMLRKGGLNPDTDVTTIVAGDVPAQLQSLASNVIQASAFSPPTVIVARPLQDECARQRGAGISHDSKWPRHHRAQTQGAAAGDSRPAESPRQGQPAIS